MIFSGAWCLPRYLANAGTLDLEFFLHSFVWSPSSSPSICDLSPSNLDWTSLIASNYESGPSKCDSVCTIYNSVSIGDLGDLGDEVSFLSNIFSNVLGS